MMLDGLDDGPRGRGRTRPDASLSEILSSLPASTKGMRPPRRGCGRHATPGCHVRGSRQRDGARGRARSGRSCSRSTRWAWTTTSSISAATRSSCSRPTRGFARGSRTTCPIVALLQYPTIRSLARLPQQRRDTSSADRAPSQRPGQHAAPGARPAAKPPGEAVADVLFRRLRRRTRASRSSASPAAFRGHGTWTSSGRTSSRAARPSRSSQTRSSTPRCPTRWRRAGSRTTCARAGSWTDVEMFDAGVLRDHPEARPRSSTPSNACSWRRHGRRWRPRATTRGASPGPIGVFAGMSNNYYFLQNLLARQDVTDIVGWLTTMMGNEKDYLATRVSYKLDLRGPALNLQTACSTSLVAVGTAVQSLLNYQCDMALAGGVSITLPQKRGYLYQEGGITSPDGHCRTFDESAAGTVFSNGVGIVTLRRLSDALEDGDTIYAVIKGAGMNNDGASKVSFTAPERRRTRRRHRPGPGACRDRSADDLLRRGPRNRHTARRSRRDRRASPRRFAPAERPARGYCAIGSVKSNIGHLDAAAGVAGLIKTALAPAPQDDSPEPALHGAEPEARSRGLAVPGRRPRCGRGSLPRARRAAPASARSASGGRTPTSSWRRLPSPRRRRDGRRRRAAARALGAVRGRPRRCHVEAARPSRGPSCDIRWPTWRSPSRPAGGGSPIAGLVVAREPTRPSRGSAPSIAKTTRRRLEHRRGRDGRVPVPWPGSAIRGHGAGALRGRSRRSVPMSTSARRSCARSWASTCATCSIPSPAAKRSRSSGSHRRQSPSPRCSSSSTRWRWRGAASGSSPTA